MARLYQPARWQVVQQVSENFAQRLGHNQNLRGSSGSHRHALVQTWHPGLLHAVAPISAEECVTGSGRADKDGMERRSPGRTDEPRHAPGPTKYMAGIGPG